METTVQTQLGEHLDALEKDIRDLRAKLLPLPPSKLVWNLGTLCRLTGSRFIALTKDLEDMERDAALNPPSAPFAEPQDLFRA